MAGAGYKLFNTGDVLLASEVNTYLMQQTVMVFANATARTSALSGVLAEGMISYLADTNATEVYNGSAWVGITGDGDITGVTAGTGISGGGTSGTVTITNDMATTITAAGDIVVGTGSGTYDNLPIGTTGQVLTADTTVSPYKVKWAAAASGGKVLQVVSATQTGYQSVKSANNTDIPGMTVTITPSSTASKVLITGMQNNITSQSYTVDQGLNFALVDGSNNSLYEIYKGTVNNFVKLACVPFTYLHSPNTTSAITYKLRTTSSTATDGVYFGNYGGGAAPVSSIIAMEIGA